jgi:Lysyl oxidase
MVRGKLLERVATLAAVAAFVAFAEPAAADTLPHITQAPAPTSSGGFSIVQVGAQTRLEFPSQINVESDGGALTIAGSRNDATVDTMDATEAGVDGVVGALQYNSNPTHRHWHYLALDRYDLRTHDASLTEVARDQKTGFCLYESATVNPTYCQQGYPAAPDVSETIDPGYNDVYGPARDGQYIDITGLTDGTYELVQWVNADCRLHDTGPADHTWAVVLQISGGTVTATTDTPYWNAHYAALSPSQQCLPAETVRPQVSGTAQAGGTLSSVPGSWLERMSDQFAYQWRRCDASGWNCADIPGATSANYVPSGDDVGHTLRARVTGTFVDDTEQGTPQDSEPTAVVAASPPSAQPPSATTFGPGPISDSTLSAALSSSRSVKVRSLVAHGLSVRVHCSEACTAALDLRGRGGVELAHLTARLAQPGTHAVRLKLSRKARRILGHFRRGTLTLWLHTKASDGEQETVSRLLRLIA